MRSYLRPVAVASLVLGSLAFALYGCNKAQDRWSDKPGPRILTSFAPLYCFAKNIAGDDASVLYVMSDTGPHEFDPKAEDAAALSRADLFIINGLGLDDDIAAKLVRSSSNKNLKIIKAGEAIPVKDLHEGGDEDEHDKKNEKDHDLNRVRYDPHVWLGIPEAIKMVERIRDALKEQDPAHAAGYEARAAKYIEELKKILAEGQAILKGKANPKVLAFHDALFYFARAFKLEVVGSIELAPGVEPSSSEMSNLIKLCRENNVIAIAVEPQFDSNTSAKVIRRELNSKGIPAEFLTIDPLETAQAEELNDKFYETKMRENLKNLAEKLK